MFACLGIVGGPVILCVRFCSFVDTVAVYRCYHFFQGSEGFPLRVSAGFWCALAGFLSAVCS